MNAVSILPELCTGCQSCEMACSLSHEGATSSALSRIQIKRWPEIAVYMPIVCQHCKDAPCMTIWSHRGPEANCRDRCGGHGSQMVCGL